MAKYGLMNKSVNSTDILTGAGAGLAGAAALKYALSKLNLSASLPAIALKIVPLVGSAIAGSALYFLQKKSNGSRATAHLVGALTAGAAVNAWSALKEAVTELNDIVELRYNGNYNGMIVNDPRYAMNGMIVNDATPRLNGYADRANLGDLAALSMTEDDDADFDGLVSVDY